MGFSISGRLSPTPAREAVQRPSPPTFNLLESDGDDADVDMDWQPRGNFTNCEDNAPVAQEPLQEPQFADNSSCLDGKPSGITRTSSEEFTFHGDEGDAILDGLFGRAANIVNTARDIAYLFWISGRRRRL